MRSVTAVLAAILVFCMLFPGAPRAAEHKELIAVLDLQGVNASDAERSALSERLREELLKSGRFVLVDRSRIDAVLREQALQQVGCAERECAVQVGQILGVRKLLAGKVTKITDTTWLVSGTMVDVDSAETLRVESVQHRGDFFALMGAGMAELATKLSADTGTAVSQQGTAGSSPADSAVPRRAGSYCFGYMPPKVGSRFRYDPRPVVPKALEQLKAEFPKMELVDLRDSELRDGNGKSIDPDDFWTRSDVFASPQPDRSAVLATARANRLDFAFTFYWEGRYPSSTQTMTVFIYDIRSGFVTKEALSVTALLNGVAHPDSVKEVEQKLAELFRNYQLFD